MLAFERIAEEKIREAIAAGELEHLPGKGKPLSLDDYFSVRPEERMAYAVLKNSGFLPEHLQWRKESEACLHELERCWEHCRRRLGKLLALWREATTKTVEPPRKGRRIFAFRPWKSWEQNAASGRGKRVATDMAEPDRRVLNAQQLQRAYLDDRLWLRRRLSELANRADEIAQREHQALVEKEIRDQRPLVFLLGSPRVSAKDILAQFDREFPEMPARAVH
jgi:hypothetical protein